MSRIMLVTCSTKILAQHYDIGGFLARLALYMHVEHVSFIPPNEAWVYM